MKMAQLEVKKLNGGGSLQGKGGGGAFYDVMDRMVPGAMWRRGGQRPAFPVGPRFPCCFTKQGGYQQVFLLRRLVLTETSRGSLIWANPPGFIVCSKETHSLLVRSLGKRGGGMKRGDF